MLKPGFKLLPTPPALSQLLGPSFILLSLGLGSGEIILWPYLVSNYGLGIAWGAFLGITFQYFINMEIERYSLARGESVFFGLSRRWRLVPYWLIVSTLLGFSWPGIIAAAAFLFSTLFGGDPTNIAIIGLLIIGVTISLGKHIYTTVEKFSQFIILFGVPCIVALALYIAKAGDWSALAAGLMGHGQGYFGLPGDMPLAPFLAAFAFSGAAGNLNLSQSSYIREKGYGMGFFTEKIKGILHGPTKVNLNGYNFKPTPQNIKRFHQWWRLVNREHAIVFYGTGLFTMLLLMVLAYTTTYGTPGNQTGINFVVNEAALIAKLTAPIIGSLFLLALGIMLFSTQFNVLDSTSRIIAESFGSIEGRLGRPIKISHLYFGALWIQIIFGIIIFSFGLKEPITLLIIEAVINAICMFVHIGLVNRLNHHELPASIKPSLPRRFMILFAFLFFGIFSLLTIWTKLFP